MTSEGVGRAILNDEDNTSVTEGGWKRTNTLAHYKVGILNELDFIM